MDILWWVGIGIAVVIILGMGAALLWWSVPKRQMRSITVDDQKVRADIEDNFRKTIGQALGTAAQVLGGIVVLIGAWLAYHGTQETLQANQEQSRFSQQASHDLLISQQVAKGFEQLGQQGPDKMVLRLGGIYALEGVMNGSAQYYTPVLEALCAFVRDATKNHTGDDPPATDIQAALSVIGRRRDGKGIVNLVGAQIQNAHLESAHLADAFLTGANLTGAILVGADLAKAVMYNINLSNANLASANLSEAMLGGANLNGASLTNSYIIWGGPGTMPKTIVSQSQLDQACGANADLPPDLTLKPCPPDLPSAPLARPEQPTFSPQVP